MNGLSLLLLLSSLSATTGVEVGANGQLVYAIRIESLLVDELRNGQAIPILVAPKDRRIRQFSISMIGDSARNNRFARTTDPNFRSADLFDYEAAQLENGEIEYVVQISPERLESLVAGRPIEGTIAADIPEVHRFLIFVGIGQLPSQQAAAQASGRGAPSLLAGTGNGLVPAGAEVRAGADPTRSTGTQLPRPGFSTPAQPTGSQPLAPRGTSIPDPLAQFGTNRTTDPRTAWRNQPDQSTVSPPPFASTGQGQFPTSTTGLPRSPTSPATVDRNAYGTTPYNPNYGNPYANAQYPDPNAQYAAANAPPVYPQQNYPGQGYPQGVPVTAGRTDVPGAPAPAGLAQNTLPVNPVAPTVVAKPDTVPERPWTPLIMTTLALFASLGANAYLGWLAWSFFWRFREAATESARARSQSSLIRQAA